MEKIKILTSVFCLSLILLVGCNQGGLLESIEQIDRLPLAGTADVDQSPSTKPVDEPSINVTTEPNEEPKPPLVETSTVIIREEDPVTPKESASSSTTEAHEPLVEVAIQDLAKRLGISDDQIKLLEVREVIWPDASLGCPQPGVVYAQVLQNGYLIRLGAGDQMYFYHSGQSQDPFLCEGTSEIIPQITPKEDEFVPPPDFEID